MDIIDSVFGSVGSVSAGLGGGLLASIGLQSSQMLFGLLFLIVILLWGFSLGRTRALVSLLSIYIAFVIEEAFPYVGHPLLGKIELIARGIMGPQSGKWDVFLTFYDNDIRIALLQPVQNLLDVLHFETEVIKASNASRLPL